MAKSPSRCPVGQHFNCRKTGPGHTEVAGQNPLGGQALGVTPRSTLAKEGAPTDNESGNTSVNAAWGAWIEYDFPPVQEEKPSLGDRIFDAAATPIDKAAGAIADILYPSTPREGKIESPSTYLSERSSSSFGWDEAEDTLSSLHAQGINLAGYSRPDRADNIPAPGSSAGEETNRTPSSGYAEINNRLTILSRNGAL